MASLPLLPLLGTFWLVHQELGLKRSVDEILATRLSDGDTVYAYCYAEPAAEYYGPGLGIAAVETLGCPRSPQEVEETIGDVEGGRVWFFYTDVPEPVWSDVAIRVLERRGTELDRITDPRVPAGEAETAAVLFQRNEGVDGGRLRSRVAGSAMTRSDPCRIARRAPAQSRSPVDRQPADAPEQRGEILAAHALTLLCERDNLHSKGHGIRRGARYDAAIVEAHWDPQ